jgi:hypothetical protein
MNTFNRKRQIQNVELSSEFKKTFNDLYDSGWNSALEMAAFRVEHEFIKAFGKDTLSSMAIYIRSLKK